MSDRVSTVDKPWYVTGGTGAAEPRRARGRTGKLQGDLTSTGSLTETVPSVPAVALFAWSVTVCRPGLGLLVAAGFLVGVAVLGASGPAGRSR